MKIGGSAMELRRRLVAILSATVFPAVLSLTLAVSRPAHAQPQQEAGMPASGPMMGHPMGMGCMHMQMMHREMMHLMQDDPKLRGRMMELHGEMMRLMGEAMIQRGKELQGTK